MKRRTLIKAVGLAPLAAGLAAAAEPVPWPTPDTWEQLAEHARACYEDWDRRDPVDGLSRRTAALAGDWWRGLPHAATLLPEPNLHDRVAADPVAAVRFMTPWVGSDVDDHGRVPLQRHQLRESAVRVYQAPFGAESLAGLAVSGGDPAPRFGTIVAATVEALYDRLRSEPAVTAVGPLSLLVRRVAWRVEVLGYVVAVGKVVRRRDPASRPAPAPTHPRDGGVPMAPFSQGGLS